MAKDPLQDIKKTTRPRLGLNHGWGFRKEKVSRAWLKGDEPGAGENILLPHSWNMRDTFQVDLRYYQGHGAYRKVFEIPDEFRKPETRLHLVSEGFYGKADFWLNGRHAGSAQGQYLGVDLDIDSLLREKGANQVAIGLDNNYHKDVLPGKEMPDFLLHGGLAGQIFLEQRPLLHLDDNSFWVRSHRPLVSRPDLEGLCVAVNDTRIQHSVKTVWMLEDPEGEVTPVYESPVYALPPGEQKTIHFKVDLPGVQRWAPEHPSQYRLTCRLMEGGDLKDTSSRRFGFREARFDGEYGFYLNGKHIYLRGVNRHECIPGFGNAVPGTLHRRDAALLKELGLNFVRLAHYPQSPDFLEACDELGIFVYAELATWKSVKRGRWLKAAHQQMRGLIQRDRHHPSVVLWGLGNESRSRKAYITLGNIAEELDPTRPTIYAENHLERGIRWRTTKLCGVLGVNYEIDRLDEAHERSKTGATLVSECCNMPRSYRGAFNTEMEQIQRYAEDLAKMKGKDFNAGYALWCFNDYPTQRKHRFQRHPGIVDAWRIPKPSAWFLKALNSDKPFVHGIVDWSSESEEKERVITIITNCKEISISCGKMKPAPLTAQTVMEYAVPFVNEPLVLNGRKGEESVAESIHPFGKPHTFNFKTEQEVVTSEYQTGSLLLEIVDRQGHQITTWNGDVDVSLEGPGNILYPFVTNLIPIRSGLGRVYFKTIGEHGSVTINACHESLQTNGVNISVVFTRPLVKEV